MLDKLQNIADKYKALQKQLYEPNIIADHTKSTAINKEIAQLQPTYDLYNHIKKYTDQANEAKELLETDDDPDIQELAQAQLKEAEKQLDGIEEKVKLALLPQDPNDSKNIYLEIRPAAGGDES